MGVKPYNSTIFSNTDTDVNFIEQEMSKLRCDLKRFKHDINQLDAERDNLKKKMGIDELMKRRKTIEYCLLQIRSHIVLFIGHENSRT